MNFRNNFVLSVTFFYVLISVPAHAWNWDDLWANPDQQASKAFRASDYDQASALFDNLAWRAAANYRNGNYESALSDLLLLDDPGSLYNRGNTLARLQRLEEAAASYREVLEQIPGHSDARINLDIVQNLLLQEQISDLENSQDIDREELDEEYEDNEDNQLTRLQENTLEPDGEEHDKNRRDTSRQETEEESEEADGNIGNSRLENTETPEQQAAAMELELELNMQQWLGRIKDEPGMLLQNKFRMQREAELDNTIELPPGSITQQTW